MQEKVSFGKFSIEKKYADLICILIGALILCSHAIYNGFPLVYPDTGTYIAACFEHFIPRDRPLVYSFFLRHISLAYSLWIPIFVQAAIISWLIFLLFRHVSNCSKPYLVFICTLVLLSLTTGIAVNAGQLIPDIFTPVVLLASGFLLFVNELSRTTKISLCILFVFAVTTHLSHLPMAAGILGWFLISAFIFRKKSSSIYSFSNAWKYLMLFPIAVLFVCILNYSQAKKWQFRPEAQHVFMMNRLLQCGILDEYLDENCGKHHYSLCNYRNFKGDFLWDEKSAINDYYGWKNDGWNKAKPEYDSIINAIFSQGKYVREFFCCSFRDSYKQLFSFKTGTTPKLSARDAIYVVMQWHFPKSLENYLNSKQISSGLDYSTFNFIQNIFICISVIPFFIFLFIPKFSRQLTPRMRGFAWLTIFGMIFNAFTVVTFAMVDDRYQSRLIWLIPLLLIVFLSNDNFRTSLKVFVKK